jgi:hypothetical protein
VSGIVVLAVLLIWGGWSLWGFFALAWCPGNDCLAYLISGGAILIGVTAIAGVVVAALCLWFYAGISHRSPVALGGACVAVLLPLLFAAGDIRSAIAAHYFPYVLWFRFGYSGIFLVWAILSILGCAAVVSIAKRGINLTMRSSGPARVGAAPSAQ